MFEPEEHSSRTRKVLAGKVTLDNLEPLVRWVNGLPGGEVTWSGVDALGYPALSLYTADGEVNAPVDSYIVFEPDRPGSHPSAQIRVLTEEQFRYEFD
ncbi:hypothetical protein [Amycolatopsis thermoflava]|uniref:hypothetical protein n=1 Tax=Amycolatopsis thermoflava TaxID=84480 RepID=UPI0004151DF5|nr:hypothetical protein [Amycolatopsis thermoflava]